MSSGEGSLYGLGGASEPPLRAAVLGGFAAIFAGLLQGVEVVLRLVPSDTGASRLTLLANLLGDAGSLLVAVALVGLYRIVTALSAEESPVATAGMIVALVAALISALMTIYDLLWFTGGSGMYGQTMMPSPQLFTQVNFLAILCAMFLLGVAGFQTGALGRWRTWPLLLALIAIPVPTLLAFVLASGAGTGVRALGLPFLIPALGLLLLGVLLLKHRSLDRPARRRPR